jgi:hypothetical protein
VIGRVGGSAADAVIVTGAVFASDDLAANYHRVGGKAANLRLCRLLSVANSCRMILPPTFTAWTASRPPYIVQPT